MRYFHILVSRPGLGRDLYQSVGYLDDTQFVRYNSDTANPRVEPRAPWMEQEGPEYWDRQTNIAREHSQASRANLQVIVGNHNHSKLGESRAPHSPAMSRGPPEFPGPTFRPEVRRSSDLSSVWEEPTRN